MKKQNKIFAANWKLNLTPDQAEEFITKLSASLSKACEVFIFPQNFSLDRVTQMIKKFQIPHLQAGPQQIHTELSGAFTGENSLQIAAQMGSQVVLLGHSERRQFFHETDVHLAQKIKKVQEQKLIPVFCIGETLEERQSGSTEKVLKAQLNSVLKNLDLKQRLIVAYEPVWAIGTGQVATLEQVKDAHLCIYTELKEIGFENFQILYGGSVKPENAKQLSSILHVDGFLIGGASLKVESFLEIINSSL